MYGIFKKNLLKCFYSSKTFIRLKSVLVLAEHNNEILYPITLNTIEAARQIGGDVTVLVAGIECATIAKLISNAKGLKRVLIAEDTAFDGFPPENLTPLILSTQRRYRFTHILAGSTTFGKSVLPRVASKLDVPVITDITSVLDQNIFVRPIYCGNAFMTLRTKDAVNVLTISESCFMPRIIEEHQRLRTTLDVVTRAMNVCKVHCDEKHNKHRMIEYLRLKRAADSISQWKYLEDNIPPIEHVCTDECNHNLTKLVKTDCSKSKRAKLVKAKIIVCGGNGLKSEKNFELLYDLARALHAEVGATKTAVDAGYAPCDLMIDHIGTIVAPSVYIGVGVSGKIQHLAGITHSKTIMAINNDPKAPIFKMANYGLTGDLFKVIPAMISKLK